MATTQTAEPDNATGPSPQSAALEVRQGVEVTVTPWGEWPLIGRDAELAHISGGLRRRRGVVIVGGAGVGKTRLAAEALTTATVQGFTVLRVAATRSTAGMPFGAFASMLPELPSGEDRAWLLSQMSRAVLDRGRGGPIAILVDDGHLLDEGSAALTSQLALAHDVVVIMTVRLDEDVSDAITALWKDDVLDRIDLRPLATASLSELLGSVLGTTVEAVTARRLLTRAAGNVLFLRELVMGAVERAVLIQDGEVWRLVGELPVTERLTELVEANLLHLGPAERTALEYLAFGEPLELATLAKLSSPDVDLARLEERRLIRTAVHADVVQVSLAHPVYADVLRQGVSEIHARQLVSTLADELAARSGSPSADDVLRLGVWRLQGGGPTEPGGLLNAARRAIALHDLGLASKLAEAATGSGGGFDSALLEAQLLQWSGYPERAEEAYSRLADAAPDEESLGLLAISRIDNLGYNLGRWPEALKIADVTEDLISADHHNLEFASYRASLLDIAGSSGGFDGLQDVIEHGQGRALAWACAMSGWSAARRGQLSRSQELTVKGLEAHHSIIWPPLPWSADTQNVIRAWALTLAGEFREARRLSQEVYARALEGGDLDTLSIAAANLCLTDVNEGRITSARQWGVEAVSGARRNGRMVVLKVATISLAEALAVGGASHEAERLLDGLQQDEFAQVAMLESERQRVQAWTSVCRDGDTDSAVRMLERAASLAQETQDWVWESAALHDQVRLGRASTEVAERLRELSQIIEGPLIALRTAHAFAVLKRDPQALAALADEFERMQARLIAAEVAAEACVLWRSQDSRRAKAAELRATDLRDACPGAVTPALLVASPARASLTPRQLLVARLAADHQSNKQIADRLRLSVRTVENNLHQAYARLGIAGRHELHQALLTRPDPPHAGRN